MRAAIRAIPDGRYRFTDVMDGDGLEAFDIPIAVEVTVDGERIRFDFAGTALQVPGSINVTLNATVAAVGYALKALVDPEVPNNQGMLDVLEVEAAPGTLVNAVFPAPVSSRAHTSQRIIDVVLGALAQALPERAVAAANGANSMAVFAGTDHRTGRPFVYLETLGGGMGGRPMKDGKDGVQVGITNTSNLPVEAIELEYPLLVEEYSLIPDSGGAGTFRGGLGLRRVVRPLGQSCLFNGVGERFRHQPWGLFGGGPGGSGRFLIVETDGSTRRIHDKPGEIRLSPEQALVVETPGAGGYGPPSERSAEGLADDRASGKFTSRFMRRHYRAD
jgi:N-methylhydantoinase B